MFFNLLKAVTAFCVAEVVCRLLYPICIMANFVSLSEDDFCSKSYRLTKVQFGNVMIWKSFGNSNLIFSSVMSNLGAVMLGRVHACFFGESKSTEFCV